MFQAQCVFIGNSQNVCSVDCTQLSKTDFTVKQCMYAAKITQTYAGIWVALTVYLARFNTAPLSCQMTLCVFSRNPPSVSQTRAPGYLKHLVCHTKTYHISRDLWNYTPVGHLLRCPRDQLSVHSALCSSDQKVVLCNWCHDFGRRPTSLVFNLPLNCHGCSTLIPGNPFILGSKVKVTWHKNKSEFICRWNAILQLAG